MPSPMNWTGCCLNDPMPFRPGHLNLYGRFDLLLSGALRFATQAGFNVKRKWTTSWEHWTAWTNR